VVIAKVLEGAGKMASLWPKSDCWPREHRICDRDL